MKTLTTTIVASLAALSLAPHVSAQDYEHSFQEQYGRSAEFFVEGSATGSSPDVEGDAMLQRVVMPTGDEFHFFYKPVNVMDISYTGPGDRWRVRGGRRSHVGLQGVYNFGASNDTDFENLIMTAMGNNNLNNYVDNSGGGSIFYFTIEFNLEVRDNDPGPDEFGEILYFERGAGNGNSWLKMQAVDEDGNALGPWLVVGPGETVQTTPQTTVMRSDQKMGTTSIDVSRLGVEEFRYLRISNDVTGEPAYTGGGDTNPDFKVMVVITDEAHLQAVTGTFD